MRTKASMPQHSHMTFIVSATLPQRLVLIDTKERPIQAHSLKREKPELRADSTALRSASAAEMEGRMSDTVEFIEEMLPRRTGLIELSCKACTLTSP